MVKNKKQKATMAAPSVEKTATVQLDGVTYQLGYDFGRICDAEAEAGTGCNLLHGLADMANLSGRQLCGLFLAALRAGDPKLKLTFAQAGKLIRFDTIVPISEALAESLLLTMPAKTAAK
jgi:hypothetical protein